MDINLTLDEIRDTLVSTYHPRMIYLFGSYAWGDPDEGSDIDLFIVLDASEQTMSDRMRVGYRALAAIAVPIDIIVYTLEELESKKSHPSSLSHRILKKGIKLYEAA